ncbi:hypothetical protein [Variovorax saccharolyticus]|uniref:hypothetical protein n=1 Tax=Variovorax saccharolyticus TaxID=3053516 RepID=UPI0025754324|nr:hypothetical protein [Variovorax sp. J31P216]MDM0029880.1 hypothetical protein [Variovorax sp. J31P216]
MHSLAQIPTSSLWDTHQFSHGTSMSGKTAHNVGHRWQSLTEIDRAALNEEVGSFLIDAVDSCSLGDPALREQHAHLSVAFLTGDSSLPPWCPDMPTSRQRGIEQVQELLKSVLTGVRYEGCFDALQALCDATTAWRAANTGVMCHSVRAPSPTKVIPSLSTGPVRKTRVKLAERSTLTFACDQMGCSHEFTGLIGKNRKILNTISNRAVTGRSPALPHELMKRLASGEGNHIFSMLASAKRIQKLVSSPGESHAILEALSKRKIMASFSSMQYSRGLPSEKEIDDMTLWCTVDGNLNTRLLRAIANMQRGKGMPTEKNVQDLTQWCMVDGELNLALLRAISGMQSSKGMPPKEDIADLLQWSTIDGQLDMVFLRAITSMQWGKGMPAREDIAALKQWCTIEGEMSMGLLLAITGMQSGRGMPAANEIDALKRWCTVDQHLNMTLLRAISCMRNGKGMLTAAALEALKTGCTVGGTPSISLMRAIGKMQQGGGVPDQQKIEDLRVRWASRADPALLREGSNRDVGRGLPSLQEIKQVARPQTEALPDADDTDWPDTEAMPTWALTSDGPQVDRDAPDFDDCAMDRHAIRNAVFDMAVRDDEYGPFAGKAHDPR